MAVVITKQEGRYRCNNFNVTSDAINNILYHHHIPHIIMVINQHYSPTSSDFGVSQTSQGIPTMLVNKDHRLPIIPIPEPPNTMDLKVVGATMENETVVL